MTLAVGGVPTAQLPAVLNTHLTRPPTPPPRHCPCRNFQIPRVPPHPYTSYQMEVTPTSHLLSHLSHSSEVFPNSSPSPPPPPPSYSISELPAADLPPPPPLTLWQEMASPCYMCCYDPPSPEVKSEYDPKLPPDFFSTPEIFPSPLPPIVPPHPQPSPLPPPNPPICQMSGASMPEASPPLHNATTFNNTVDLFPEAALEPEGCEDHSVETCSTSSLMSSSTLTATYFQTPDSASSPLPPHVFRVSPLSTDAVTLSSQVSIDSITPSSDISLTPNSLSASQEYTLHSNTSELMPQASVHMDTLFDASFSPDPSLPSLLMASKLEQQGSPIQTTGPYRWMESIKSEDGSSIPSEVSCTTNDTAGPAIMSSPLSTDIPSLPSLPTDPDSQSSGLGSLTTDTWSLSTEVDSQSGDGSIVRTKTSSSSALDTAYTTNESGAVSPAFTASCTITPMPSDYLTPLFSSPATTPIPSPLPSSPLPYLYKSESPLNSGSTTPQDMASQEPLQTANREFSSLSSSRVPIPQATSTEHSSSLCHSFTPPSQSHCCSELNISASQPPSSLATEQYMTHTKENATENSDSTEILANLTQSNPDINSFLQRTSYEKKTGSHGVPHNTDSLENGQFSKQITEEQRSDVIEKREEMKDCTTNGSENEESTDEQSRKNNSVQTMYEEGNHDAMESRENGDSHVVKDVNGNISYLGLEDGHEARLKNEEDVNESRPQVLQNIGSHTTKVSLAGTTQPNEDVRGHENIFSEVLNVLSSRSSPVASPSSAHSPVPCSITPSIPGIPSSDALLLSPHNKAALVSYIGRDIVSPHSGTPSTFTHCNLASSKPEPCRVAQVPSKPKEAMELLNAVVINLENLSADLPASPTSRAPDPSPQQARAFTVLRRSDQSVTHISETSKVPVVGDSKDGDHEELKEAACHLSQSSLIHTPPPHPTPISPALSSHNFPPTTIMPPHACMSVYCDEPSTYVSSPSPSLTTNTINPAYDMSVPFWNMPDPDTGSFPSSGTSADHTKTNSPVKDNTESASKEEVLLCSQRNDFQDSFPVGCGTPLPSLCSSPKPGSLLDGQPPPSPAPCSRTPPTPPPRSCHNTPRSSLAPPLPPVRQYMLVPINQPLRAPRQHSPPPAPPRSTSVRRSSPPPPPRPTAPHQPPPVQEWNKGPPLPPPPVSSSLNTPQPALTPVPEESSNPQSPVLSKSPQSSSPLCEDVHSQTVLPSDSLATSQQLPSLTPSSSEDPPALPPPPEDEQEDEDLPPPPPPPPLIESDEAAPPLPLPPPPPPHVLLSPPSPLSPTPGKAELSTPLYPCQEPALPVLCVAASHTNLSSAPSSDSDLLPPAVGDVAIPPPPTIPNITTSPKSPMPDSQAVDAADASSLPLIPAPPHAPPPCPPVPPCALGPNIGKLAKSPLITTSPYGKMVVVRSDLPLPTPEEEVRVAFTTAKDWGFLAESEDTLSVYTQLRPIIQQGPQCGLVALSMASQVFPQTVEVEEILAAGRAQGVTQHGEMFSAMALARLAEKTVTGLQAEVRRDVLSTPATLLQLLLQGDLMLVPYDAEKNHQPGQKGGHKAHWGVVCGCLVQSSALTFPTAAAKLDSHVDHLWHLRPRSRAGRSRSVTPCTPTLPSSPKVGQRGFKTLDGAGGSEGNPSSVSCSRVATPMLSDLRHDDELRLVALWRQGKSRKVVAAPLDQLCESNDQLVSYPPPTTTQEAEYVVGSVQEELAGQVVVLHKTKAALSDLVGLLQEK